MSEDVKQPRGDWTRVQEFESRLAMGERLTVDDDTRDLLRRVGEQIVLAPDYVNERLASAEGAEALLREEVARALGERAFAIPGDIIADGVPESIVERTVERSHPATAAMPGSGGSWPTS